MEDMNMNDSLPDYVQTILDGCNSCGDTNSPFAKPHWYNAEQFRRGQTFAARNSSAILFADLLSLLMLFSLQGGLEPLIFTGQSDTPFKAFKRYLSTAVRVVSWYETDIWDETSEGHKNLKTVRRKHEAVRRRMTELTREDVKTRGTLESGTSKIWTSQEDLKKDFEKICPLRIIIDRDTKPVYLNQSEMATTQIGFLGLVLLYPRMFGIHSASKADFEGFIHLWRTLGYLLGIDDRYNLCTGSYDEVLQRCRDLLEVLIKPSLRSVSGDWVHMSRCAMQGIGYLAPGLSFEVCLLYLCTVLSIDVPRLSANLTIWQRCVYYQICVMYGCFYRIPGVLWFMNLMVRLAMKRAKRTSAGNERSYNKE